jgi:hypothetical protein
MSAPLSYALLRKNYPTHAQFDGAALYASIGHPAKGKDLSWQNTCAIRVSLALLGAHIPVGPGYMTVQAGPHKGKRIESRQKVLSEFLRQRLGQPEVYKDGYQAWSKIRPRRGIVSFMGIYGNGSTQGHIDLIEPAEMDDLQCATSCYWSSAEVWFWPLR